MTPLTMKDTVVSIAGTDYGAECSSMILTPNTPVSAWKGLKPDAITQSVGNTVWSLDMSIGVDWDDAASLGRYLFENAGDSVALEFRPKTGGAGITATVMVIPGAIGGAVDQTATATVSLPVVGAPAFLAATP